MNMSNDAATKTITIAFTIDLRNLAATLKPTDKTKAIQTLQDCANSGNLIGSALMEGGQHVFLIPLKAKEAVFGELIYWCKHWGIRYTTRWFMNELG